MTDVLRREVAPEVVPPCWIIGPRSMIVDRIVPRLEFSWMPKTIQPGGLIELHRTSSGLAPETRHGWRILAHRLIKRDYGCSNQDGCTIDLRQNTPGNWAHSNIFHLPLAAMARQWIGDTPNVLLPFKTPKYIRRLYEHFGFPVICTDREVRGDIIALKLSANDVLRPARRDLAKLLISDLQQRHALTQQPVALSQKIFVSRRKTRRIENEAEIESYLRPLGFVKIYPEELSVAEQIGVFSLA